MRIFSILFLIALQIVSAQTAITTVGILPTEVSESSGLIYFNNHLITHNDSDNTAQLFELDTLTREIIRTVKIVNAVNQDWEAITQDETYIYIGDFGNNLGLRKDLRIYRILKTDFLRSNSVTAAIINFSYEDQTDFTNTGNSDWDTESFFVLKDHFILLTKQWKSLGTVAYKLPISLGTHSAVRYDETTNLGLVTDVTFNENDDSILLVGYSSFLLPFAKLYTLTEDDKLFSNTATTISLNVGFAQIEGVAVGENNCYYFTSEYFSRQMPSIVSEARLFKKKIEEVEEVAEGNLDEKEIEEGVATENMPRSAAPNLSIYKDIASGQIGYRIQNANNYKNTSVYNINGQKVWELVDKANWEEGFIVPLQNAVYYFVVNLENLTLTKPFLMY